MAEEPPSLKLSALDYEFFFKALIFWTLFLVAETCGKNCSSTTLSDYMLSSRWRNLSKFVFARFLAGEFSSKDDLKLSWLMLLDLFRFLFFRFLTSAPLAKRSLLGMTRFTFAVFFKWSEEETNLWRLFTCSIDPLILYLLRAECFELVRERVEERDAMSRDETPYKFYFKRFLDGLMLDGLLVCCVPPRPRLLDRPPSTEFDRDDTFDYSI